MSIDTFKTYLSKRPYIEESYTDEDLTKVLEFAKIILLLFYKIDDEFQNSSQFEFPLFEEAIYLLQNDPTFQYLSKYEGLSQFSIAGTITATVAREYLPYLSPLVTRYFEKLNLFPIIKDNTTISYSYTTF